MTLIAERHAMEVIAPSRRHQWMVLLSHAFVGWFLCGLTMWIGMAVTTVENAQIVHAIAAPVLFFGLSWNYHRRYGFTLPIATAAIFMLFVIGMDVVVVALLIERSFEMFTSLLGTWIPFALIFASTYLTGRWVESRAG